MHLEDKIRELKKDINLQPDRKAEVFRMLLDKIETGAVADSALRVVNRGRLNMQRSHWLVYYLNRMPIVAAILILALVGGGGVSLAANNSLPGDFLYPVKVGFNEKVEGAFQVGDQSQAEWEVRLASVRLDEAAELAQQHRIDAETRAEADAGFKAHEEKAEAMIAKLSSQNNAAASLAVSSDLESSLKAHRQIFILLEANANASTGIDVSAKLNKAVELRHKSEVEVEAGAESKPEVKAAAEGKIDAAANVIASVKNFLEVHKSNLSADASAEAQARLSKAQDLEAQAKAKVDAGDFGTAFMLAQESLRTAQEARMVLEAGVNLGIGLQLKFGEDNEASGSAEIEVQEQGNVSSSATSSEEMENKNENGSKARTKVKIELKGNVGL